MTLLRAPWDTKGKSFKGNLLRKLYQSYEELSFFYAGYKYVGLLLLSTMRSRHA